MLYMTCLSGLHWVLYFLQKGLVGFSFTSGPVTPEFVHTALLGLLHSGWDGLGLDFDYWWNIVVWKKGHLWVDCWIFIFSQSSLKILCQRLLQVPSVGWEIVNVYGPPAEKTRRAQGSQREEGLKRTSDLHCKSLQQSHCKADALAWLPQ